MPCAYSSVHPAPVRSDFFSFFLASDFLLEEWKEGRDGRNGNALWDLFSIEPLGFRIQTTLCMHICGDFDFSILLHIAKIYIYTYIKWLGDQLKRRYPGTENQGLSKLASFYKILYSSQRPGPPKSHEYLRRDPHPGKSARYVEGSSSGRARFEF